jgi:hypothetical protein
MLSFAAVCALAFALQASAPAKAPVAKEAPAARKSAASAEIDLPLDQQLLAVKRIYVEDFGDDPISKQIQSMVVASLTESKRLIVTENKDRADALLKGSATEKSSQELHAYGEATAAGAAAGGHSSSHGVFGGSSSGGFASRSAAIQDSSVNTETIDHAQIGVRLVNRDGDVIWSTAQESKGAKYKGASADVADKIVKQLLRDIEKVQNKLTPTPAR